MQTQTTQEAQVRFSGQGYWGQARGEAGGIRFLADGGLYLPEQVVVEDIARDGGSGPHRGVTFAIYSPKSALRATLVLDYGPDDHRLATRLMAGR